VSAMRPEYASRVPANGCCDVFERGREEQKFEGKKKKRKNNFQTLSWGFKSPHGSNSPIFTSRRQLDEFARFLLKLYIIFKDLYGWCI